jgi:LCP family protein required for cell wall assembly
MDTNNKQQKVPQRVRPRNIDGFVSERRPASFTSDRVAFRSSQRATFEAQPPPQPAPPIESFPLPRYYAPERPKKVIRKRRSGKMLMLRAASLLIAVFLASGGFLAWKGYSKFHKVFHGTTTVAALAGKPVTPDLLKGEGDGRVNILLLGLGGPGHDGPDLTDTMVVLSVDPVNNTAAMLSIPRDLWVKMPVNYFGSNQKINASYESGKYHFLGKMDASSANAQAVQAGFDTTDQVVSQVLGVNINYHLLLDFKAFRQAIDTVGGVDVNVKEALIDPTMAWENHNNPVLAPAGPQLMDGEKALQFARSRETSSDFARAERQRQILISLKDKVLSAGTLSNPAKIDGLMNAFGDNMYSDLSTQGATRLMTIMKQVSDTKITSLSLAEPPHQLVTTDHVGTASVVRPLAGFGNYSDYVRSQLKDGYLVKENAPLAVLSPTTAMATATAATLTNYGYNVVSSAVATQPASHTMVVDLSGGKDPYTRHYLEDRYNVKALTALPADITIPSAGVKFVIIDPR